MTLDLYKETLQQAQSVLFRYGLGAVLSIGLTIWLAYSVASEVRGLREDTRALRQELQHHSQMDSFYLRAICLNLAKGDWGAAQNCNPQ